MFYSPKLYFRDWWITAPLVGAVLTQFFLWWYLIANIKPDTDQIFLHYDIIFGVDLVGNWWGIFYLPAAGMAVILINYFFSSLLYAREKFLARLLSFWAIFFHLFLLIGTIFLVRLNA